MNKLFSYKHSKSKNITVKNWTNLLQTGVYIHSFTVIKMANYQNEATFVYIS